MIAVKTLILLLVSRWIEVATLGLALGAVALFCLTPEPPRKDFPQVPAPQRAIVTELRNAIESPTEAERRLEVAIASLYENSSHNHCFISRVAARRAAKGESNLAKSASFIASGTGSYEGIRTLVSLMLYEHPALSLDKLELSRATSEPGYLEFSTEWTLFPEAAISPRTAPGR